MINSKQNTIKVKVEFYDKYEEEKFQFYPNKENIFKVADSIVEIPIEEFLTYFLFHRKRPGKPGYRSFYEISQHIRKSLAILEDFVIFNGSSIANSPDIGKQEDSLTEMIGESVGLSVVSKIHGLSNADWEKVPERGGKGAVKVFDYQIASDGEYVIQVETKGNSCESNLLKNSSISNHKKSISEKKANCQLMQKKGEYPFPADLRYGAISVIDSRENSLLKCLLVDPEPQFGFDPRKIRILNRMRFLRDLISFVSPRSQLASAIVNRTNALESLSNPFELDNVPLLKGDLEPLEFSELHYGYVPSFFGTKSRISDGPAGGVVIQTSNDFLFFFGFKDELLNLAAEQNFNRIISYKSSSGIINKTIRCVFNATRYQTLRLPSWIKPQKDGSYYSFIIDGTMVYNQDGLVFGVLPLGEKKLFGGRF